MNRLKIEPLILKSIELAILDHDYGIKIVFDGTIDMIDPYNDIYPFLKNIHNEIVENNIKNVNADFINLKFMNSSGIKTFILWLMLINEVPEEKKYVINIIHNP